MNNTQIQSQARPHSQPRSQPHSQPQSEENFLREILFVVFAQKRLIIDTAVVIFMLVLAVAFLSPQKYNGQAALMVKGKRVERNPEMIEQIRERSLPITREDLNSELQILSSSAVLKRTVLEAGKKHGLFGLKALATQNLENNPDNDPDQNQDDTSQLQNPRITKAVNKLKSALDITVVPSSNVLEIKLRWRAPTEAKQLLDILIAQYFNYRNSVYKPQKVRNFYDQTVNDYQASIDEKHQQLVVVIDQIKATSAHKEIESNLTLKKEYGQQLGQLEQQRLSTAAQVDLLTQQLNNGNKNPNFDIKDIRLFANIENTSIRELAAKVQQNLSVHTDIAKDFLPASSKAKGATRKLTKSYDILIREVNAVWQQQQGELKAVTGSIAFLQQRINELDQRNLKLAKLQVELDKIDRDKDLLEQSFANYYKLREESYMFERTQNASLNTQVILLTPAWADPAAVFPNKRLLIPFGLIIALLVAFTAGFINEYFDDTIKRPDDSVKFIGVPSLLSFSDQDPATRQSRLLSLLDYLRRLSKKQAAGVAMVLLAALIWHFVDPLNPAAEPSNSNASITKSVADPITQPVAATTTKAVTKPDADPIATTVKTAKLNPAIQIDKPLVIAKTLPNVNQTKGLTEQNSQAKMAKNNHEQSVLAGVEKHISDWTQAWQTQNSTQYFATYAADHTPKGYASHRAWTQKRKPRIESPNWIKLNHSPIQLIRQTSQSASALFWLSYKTPNYQDNTLKQLDLIKQNQQWLIVAEHNLQVKRK